MSFILDALKKSEIERQRQASPGLVEIPVSARRPFPVWALALSVLLVINIAVLTGVLMRNKAPPAPAAPAKLARTAQAAADQAPPAVEHFSPLAAAPVYAPEITEPVPAPLAAAPHPAAPRDAPRPLAHRADPVLTTQDSEPDADELLPSISQVNLTGAQALPELHLDVHVYATRPADRFVYINMRKYHEGNALQEGPVVERIRRDGVVLSFQGLRFILPRQS
jgi:general secretion pathway protein B